MGRVSEEYMYHDNVSCLAVGLFEVKCWWLPWERAGCCWHFPATSLTSQKLHVHPVHTQTPVEPHFTSCFSTHILPFTIPSHPPSSDKSSHRHRCQAQQQPPWRPPPRSLSAGKTTPSLYPFHLPFCTLAPPTAYKTTHPAHPMATAKPSSPPFRRLRVVQARVRCRREPMSYPTSFPTP